MPPALHQPGLQWWLSASLRGVLQIAWMEPKLSGNMEEIHSKLLQALRRHSEPPRPHSGPNGLTPPTPPSPPRDMLSMCCVTSLSLLLVTHGVHASSNLYTVCCEGGGNHHARPGT